MRFCFEMKKSLGEFINEKWDLIKLSIIKNHVKIVTSMIMQDASFIISQSNVISIYDLRLNRWIQNIEVSKPIIKLFKPNHSNEISVLTDNFGVQSIIQSSNYNKINDESKMGRWNLLPQSPLI